VPVAYAVLPFPEIPPEGPPFQLEGSLTLNTNPDASPNPNPRLGLLAGAGVALDAALLRRYADQGECADAPEARRRDTRELSFDLTPPAPDAEAAAAATAAAEEEKAFLHTARTARQIISMGEADVNLIKGQAEEYEAELQRYRGIIQRLLVEVDRRTEAIRVCGGEIQQLRTERNEAERERARAQETLDAYAERERQEAALIEVELGLADGAGPPRPPGHVDALLRQLAPAELVGLLRGLIQRHQALRASHDELRATAAEATKITKEHTSLQKRHRKLERAHMVQTALVQKLQSGASKLEEYKETVTMQERIIKRLEAAVKLQLRPRESEAEVRRAEAAAERAAAEAKASAEAVALSEEAETLRSLLAVKDQEIAAKDRELAEMREANQSSLADSDSKASLLADKADEMAELEKRIRELEDEMRSKESEWRFKLENMEDALELESDKREVIEQQLEDDARRGAKELGALKMKLMNYEMGVDMEF